MLLRTQVGLLIYKNWMVNLRTLPLSICLLFVPATIVTTFFLMRASAAIRVADKKYYPTSRVLPNWNMFSENEILGYAPSTDGTYRVMKRISDQIATLNPDLNMSIMGFHSEADAVSYFRKTKSQISMIIVFNTTVQQKLLPKNMHVTLRPESTLFDWHSGIAFSPITSRNYSEVKTTYTSSGFLFMQALVFKSLIEFWLFETTKKDILFTFEASYKRFAVPENIDDAISVLVHSNSQFIMSLCYTILATTYTRLLIHEKQLKGMLSVVGLSTLAQNIAWFLCFCCHITISVIFLSIGFCTDNSKIGVILKNSDAVIIFMFLMCYAISVVTYCFAVSSLTYHANRGVLICAVGSLLLYLQFDYISQNYDTASIVSKIFFSFSFNCAMSIGMRIVGTFERQGLGINWSTWNNQPTPGDNYTLMNAMIMLIFDSCLHLAFAWYMENVRPGAFGTAHKPYFCFTKEYWSAQTFDEVVVFHKKDKHIVEDPPAGLKPGIILANLTKKYEQYFAVSGTSMSIYEGRITVLLGRSGCGKTTMMSLLAGLIEPTSGTAFIAGYDIKTQLVVAREQLSLCPERDILFDRLTVYQHLKFYLKVKVGGEMDIKNQIEQAAKQVELQDKLNVLAKKLSDPDKRALSVAIALIGKSKVILLDAPTAGMSPASRRMIWALLQEACKTRLIFVTTISMEEAESIGDMIAIMSEGEVKCYGSPLFLRKTYDIGYLLVFRKAKHCDVHALTKFLGAALPRIEVEHMNRNAEATYLIPDSEASQLPRLFHSLEQNKQNLHIESFGLIATTMEEVLFRVAEKVSPRDTAPVIVTSMDQPNYSNLQINIADAVQTLVIVKRAQCDVHNITTTIRFFLPNATVSRETALEVTYTFTESEPGMFQDLLSALENNKDELGIEALEQPSDTDLTKQAYDLGAFFKSTLLRTGQKGFVTEDTQPLSFNTGFTRATGVPLMLSRMRAILTKRAIYTSRKVAVTVVQMTSPFIIVLVLLTFSVQAPMDSRSYLNFDLKPFGSTYIPYSAGEKPTANSTLLAHLYSKQFVADHRLEYFKDYKRETFDNYTVNRVYKLGKQVFKRKMIIGMEVTKMDPFSPIMATAYFNAVPFHSEPIALNYLMNAIFKYTMNDSYSFQSAIFPLYQLANSDDLSTYILRITTALLVNLAMSTCVSMCNYYIIKERQIGSKHLQSLCGIGPLAYWVPTFLWDFTIYSISSFSLISLFVLFDREALTKEGRWTLSITALLLYGWSALPQMYAFQFLFKSPIAGVLSAIALGAFTGNIPTVLGIILVSAPVGRVSLSYFVDWFFLVVSPAYNLCSCLINIDLNYYNTKSCSQFMNLCGSGLKNPCCKDNCGLKCTPVQNNYMSYKYPGIGRYINGMINQGLIYAFLVMAIENFFIQKIWYYFAAEPTDELLKSRKKTDDRDVASERQRITSTRSSLLLYADLMVVANVFKRFNDLVAVDHICFGVHDQECFGILGKSGAGKTTLLRILSADLMLNGGNAYLKGVDLKTHITKVQKLIGYCPQIDPLIGEMTGRETLNMFARLKGIRSNKIKTVVDMLAASLLLTPYINKRSGKYSPGTKRKLSLAIALIGKPSFLLLDAPTIGMSVEDKKNIWMVLSKVRATGCTILLSTASFEEGEALCTRFAIMVNGGFTCLGSSQHLKNKFGQGYTLIIYLGTLEDGHPKPGQPVIDYMVGQFHGAKVYDDLEGTIHFQIPDTTISITEAFRIMERVKKKFNIDNYCVHQSTLEQIYETFIKTQRTTRIEEED